MIDDQICLRIESSSSSSSSSLIQLPTHGVFSSITLPFHKLTIQVDNQSNHVQGIICPFSLHVPLLRNTDLPLQFKAMVWKWSISPTTRYRVAIKNISKPTRKKLLGLERLSEQGRTPKGLQALQTVGMCFFCLHILQRCWHWSVVAFCRPLVFLLEWLCIYSGSWPYTMIPLIGMTNIIKGYCTILQITDLCRFLSSCFL